nr:hypothetical protein [Tanacetum cinerariifolium]
MKNKVEAQPRNVYKKNLVVKPIRNVDVSQSQLNANSELICATCKKSMFDGVHDMCLLDFVENVNSRRTFTIVGPSCPLSRITSANLKFNSIKDAKKLLEAIEKIFGGNATTKKNQRNLLKQQYENFTAPSLKILKKLLEDVEKRIGGNTSTKKTQRNLLKQQYENFTSLSSKMLNQTFDMLQKLNTHVVVWRNKADLDTIRMDDLYNNLKVYEPEVKGMSSSSSSTQNMAFVSSLNNNTSITNRAVNTSHGVFTASTQVNGSLLLMAMRLLVSISPKWSATTATRGDILLGSEELQEIKTTSTRKAQEGLCMWKHLLLQLCSKAFRVFNSRTRIVEENLYIRFNESTPNFVGSGPDWLFDIDALTRTINYEPIIAGTQSNSFADPKSSQDDGSKSSSDDRKKVDEDPRKENECNDKEKEYNVNSSNNDNIVSLTVNTTSTNRVNDVGENISIKLKFNPNMPALEDVSTFYFSSDDEDDHAMAEMNNLDTTIQVSLIPTIRIHKDHHLDQVIGDLQSATQTKKISKNLEEHGFVSTIQQRTNHNDLQNCLFACFYHRKNPKRYQVNPKVLHPHAVKRNFSLRHNMVAFLSKPTESDGFEQIVDFINAHHIRYALIVNPTIYVSCIEQFWSTAMAKTINEEAQLHAKVDENKIIVTELSVRRDLQLADDEGLAIPTDPQHTPAIIQPSSSQPQKTQKPRNPTRKKTQVPQPSGPTKSIVDEAVHKELSDRLVMAATTISSLEAEQDSGNITKTQSKATPNEPSSQGTNSGGDPMCQETIRDTIAQTSPKLDELMALCTNIQNKVLDLEQTKTTQKNEIASLKRKDKKIEKINRSRTHRLKRLYKVGLMARVESSDNEESMGEDASKQERRIDAIDADEEITLVSVHDEVVSNDADKKMFDVDVLEMTLAQALEALRSLKPKVKGIGFQEPGKSTTQTTKISSQQSQDKGKGIMIEQPVKPKKKDQIRLDEEERLTREKVEKEERANIALIEEWDDI